MARVLTGIQSTGIPHLGNVLGAIFPAISSAKKSQEGLFFIADLHSLTALHNASQRKEYTHHIAAAWLACGLNPKKHILYRQSRIGAHTELMWYLACVTPLPMLMNAHAFKSRKDALHHINIGLFAYPVLMAADILLYRADFVPVGEDQRQHMEIARDIAQHFHRIYGNVFHIPTGVFDSNKQVILGKDGQKMSKSYGNTIDIFAKESILRKQVMSIQTDNASVASPKDPDGCVVYHLYSQIASSSEVKALRARYIAGGLGYAAAKTALWEAILSRFGEVRRLYSLYVEDSQYLEEVLKEGEARAQALSISTLRAVRKLIGF